MYRFETTEQNNEKANEYETKALLYLLSFHKDSRKIDYFAIDCFNDITGCNKNYSMLWDVQSKNVASLTPSTIGKALITLYLNFIHEFPFEHFILFMPKLKLGYLKNENKKLYRIDNFREPQQEKIKTGLKNEYCRRKNKLLFDNNINDFLNKILFVIGDNSKADYIRNITKFKTNKLSNNFFENIFEEIKNKQSAIKNISIHNQEIEKPEDIEKTKKVLKRTDFDILIINRFIGINLFKDLNYAPIEFFEIIKDENSENKKNIIQNCNSEIAKMLFDKNNRNNFWNFFEILLILIDENINFLPTDILKKLQEEYKNKIICLSELTILYLISYIKEGITKQEGSSNAY